MKVKMYGQKRLIKQPNNTRDLRYLKSSASVSRSPKPWRPRKGKTMAKNPKNNPVCEYLAASIAEIKKNGKTTLSGAGALTRAYNALVMEPPPCPDDCLWAKMQRPQKCACCCRNRHMKDLYERG